MRSFKSSLTCLFLALSFIISSCSVQANEVTEVAAEEVTDESLEVTLEELDYHKALRGFREANCKPDIEKASPGVGGEYDAGMWAPPTGVVVTSFPDDLIKFGDALEYGNSIENALIVSLAYMEKLDSLYTYVHGMYSSELRSSKRTYNQFLEKALTASRKLCNLEPAGYEFLGFTTDEYGDRVRAPEIDKNCANVDPKDVIKTIKIEDGIDFYCLRNTNLSTKQENVVNPILQNLLDNWDSLSTFVKATEYGIEKISEGISSELEKNLPHCVEYPTDNPGYKIVKCTNLP